MVFYSLMCINAGGSKPPPYGNFATDVILYYRARCQHRAANYAKWADNIRPYDIVGVNVDQVGAAICRPPEYRKHIKKDRYTVYRSFDLPNDYSRSATKSPIWAVVTGRKPSS